MLLPRIGDEHQPAGDPPVGICGTPAGLEDAAGVARGEDDRGGRKRHTALGNQNVAAAQQEADRQAGKVWKPSFGPLA